MAHVAPHDAGLRSEDALTTLNANDLLDDFQQFIAPDRFGTEEMGIEGVGIDGVGGDDCVCDETEYTNYIYTYDGRLIREHLGEIWRRDYRNK